VYKANPGVWHLRLAEGRASELYDLVSANRIKVRASEKLFAGQKEVPIFLDNFGGEFVSLKVIF